jgi:LAS superfamily LD-carboxypeptidase LdcB
VSESSIQLNQYSLGEEGAGNSFRAIPDAAEALQKLYQMGVEQGFAIEVASGHRSYEHQLTIWKEKVAGKRAVLDINEQPLDIAQLSPKNLLFAILRWSAIPGFSRHHWGSDFDIYDRSSLPTPDYQVQLTQQESAPDGIFGKFHNWLDQLIINSESEGFFHPFKQERNGVAPEPWHISHGPTAIKFEQQLTLTKFEMAISHTSIPLKQEILSNSQEVFERFIL